MFQYLHGHVVLVIICLLYLFQLSCNIVLKE